MIQPNWTFADVTAGINSFMNLDPVKALMISIIVLGLVGYIFRTLASFFAGNH